MSDQQSIINQQSEITNVVSQSNSKSSSPINSNHEVEWPTTSVQTVTHQTTNASKSQSGYSEYGQHQSSPINSSNSNSPDNNSPINTSIIQSSLSVSSSSLFPNSSASVKSNLYIAGLPEKFTDQELTELFAKFGHIVEQNFSVRCVDCAFLSSPVWAGDFLHLLYFACLSSS